VCILCIALLPSFRAASDGKKETKKRRSCSAARLLFDVSLELSTTYSLPRRSQVRKENKNRRRTRRTLWWRALTTADTDTHTEREREKRSHVESLSRLSLCEGRALDVFVFLEIFCGFGGHFFGKMREKMTAELLAFEEKKKKKEQPTTTTRGGNPSSSSSLFGGGGGGSGSKYSRYRACVDPKTKRWFYFDAIGKRSSWGKVLPKRTVKIEREEEAENDGEMGEWYRVEDSRLIRPYWFRNGGKDGTERERRWEKPSVASVSVPVEEETGGGGGGVVEEDDDDDDDDDDDIEFDPDAYENDDDDEQQRTAAAAEQTRRAEVSRKEEPPAAEAARANNTIEEMEKEEEPTTAPEAAVPPPPSAAEILSDNLSAKNKALDAFFALCEKAKINEHSRWERDMPKLRKMDKNAFESFATMPERRNAFNKYKVKLSSGAAAVAATSMKESKESKLEREKVAREKREREILEKKRDDEYRLKKLKRNQDKGDAMKQFETLLAESVKSIDDVETFDDVRELLEQDPLGRASSDGPLSRADMIAAFDRFLLEFKTTSARRYEELCQETVSALSQSVGGVADEEDEIFAWEVARDVLKEDARFDRCPMKLRRSTFEKAVENFREERIRNNASGGGGVTALDDVV